MANMSNAYGNITFESTSLDYLAIFVHYFQRVKSEEYYNMTLEWTRKYDFEYNKNQIKKFSKKTVSNNETIYSYWSIFYGFGKYCFRNNFDFFFNLEKYEVEINELTGSKYEDVIKSMTIKLDYIDEEPASEMLEEVSAVLVPKIETIHEKKVYSCEAVDCKVTNYDYTAENLRNFECCDEACSLSYILKYVDYYFEEYKEEAREILTDTLLKNPKEAETVFTSLNDLIRYFDLPL